MQTIEYLPLESLKPSVDNPRTIKDEQFQRLCTSIKDNPDYFETRPILVNPDMEIFAGNMRYRAAKHLGLTEVPVAVMDISPERQREIMIRDNRDNGDWDFSKLANEWEVDELVEWGFEKWELSQGSNLSDDNDEDEQAGVRRQKDVECPECGAEFTI